VLLQLPRLIQLHLLLQLWVQPLLLFAPCWLALLLQTAA
jgi:hypothetical protein